MEAFFKWLVNLFRALFGLDDSQIVISPSPSYPPFNPDPEISLPEPDPIEPPTVPKDPTKYAVLIGINIYEEPGNDLAGCVNDVESIYEILTGLYAFDPANIRVLTDERATRTAIIEAMHWLVDNRVAGDELFLHYSGHGSQVVDWDGDELSDGLDEILVPYDNTWDNPLSDDIIHSIFKGLHPEAYLTFVCDSCHSGTMTRGVTRMNNLENTQESTKAKLPVDLGQGVTERFLGPPIDITLRSNKKDLTRVHLGMKEKDIAGEQRHVLLSGCRDEEYSSDAFINDRWQGALTAALSIALRDDPYRSWIEVHRDVVALLKGAAFEQNPRLSGDASLTDGRVILGGLQ
jgi:hypothetical protein